MERNKVKLTLRAENYAQWYLDVAKTGELYANSPTPGCITFLPKAVTIWEKIKNHISVKLKALGVQDIYLPLLIPMSFLEKEKEHVEGFSPELAVVTYAGGKQLTEKYTIRPTSETLFCDFFKERLHSYRDLPLLYNQWVNIMRWEKRTRPFLRTAEFYWQEGHTLHETITEAEKFALQILHDVYIDVSENLLAITGIAGQKSESEKFAGATKSYSYEPMMSNGRALQICTSHLLSSNFAKQFDLKFLDNTGQVGYPSYTSWGLSTRSIGAVISAHSDDAGLIIPPRLSEYSAMILPIYGKDNSEQIGEYVRKIAKIITGHEKLIPVKGESYQAIGDENKKVLIDSRNLRLGEKINDFELSGYPIRIECGARDIMEEKCVVTSRITKEKLIINISQLPEIINKFLNEGQEYLLNQSRNKLISNIVYLQNIEEMGKYIEEGKFIFYPWDRNPKLEEIIKDKYKATTRCVPFAGQFTDNLIPANNQGESHVIIARNF